MTNERHHDDPLPARPSPTGDEAITALLLGELPENLAAPLRDRLRDDRGLAAERDRLEQTLGLVRQGLASGPASAAPRLRTNQRAALLALANAPASPQPPAKVESIARAPRGRSITGPAWAMAAVAIVVLAVVWTSPNGMNSAPRQAMVGKSISFASEPADEMRQQKLQAGASAIPAAAARDNKLTGAAPSAGTELLFARVSQDSTELVAMETSTVVPEWKEGESLEANIPSEGDVWRLKNERQLAMTAIDPMDVPEMASPASPQAGAPQPAPAPAPAPATAVGDDKLRLILSAPVDKTVALEGRAASDPLAESPASADVPWTADGVARTAPGSAPASRIPVIQYRDAMPLVLESEESSPVRTASARAIPPDYGNVGPLPSARRHDAALDPNRAMEQRAMQRGGGMMDDRMAGRESAAAIAPASSTATPLFDDLPGAPSPKREFFAASGGEHRPAWGRATGELARRKKDASNEDGDAPRAPLSDVIAEAAIGAGPLAVRDGVWATFAGYDRTRPELVWLLIAVSAADAQAGIQIGFEQNQGITAWRMVGDDSAAEPAMAGIVTPFAAASSEPSPFTAGASPTVGVDVRVVLYQIQWDAGALQQEKPLPVKVRKGADDSPAELLLINVTPLLRAPAPLRRAVVAADWAERRAQGIPIEDEQRNRWRELLWDAEPAEGANQILDPLVESIAR